MSHDSSELGTRRNPLLVESWLVYSVLILSLCAVGIHAAIITLAWLDYRGKFREHRTGSVSDRDGNPHSHQPSTTDGTLGVFRFSSMAELSRQTSLRVTNLTLPGLSPRGAFTTGSSSHNSDEFPSTGAVDNGTDLTDDPEMSKHPQSVSTRRLKMRKRIQRQRSRRQRRNSNARVRDRMSIPLLWMQYTIWMVNGSVCLFWSFLITDLLFNKAQVLSVAYCNWSLCLTLFLMLVGKLVLRMLLVYRLDTSFRGTKYQVSSWILYSLMLFIGVSSLIQIVLMIDKVFSDVLIAESKDENIRMCAVDLYYKDRSAYVLTIGMFVKQMVSIMNRCRDRYALSVVRKIIVLSICDVLMGLVLFAVLMPVNRNGFYLLPLTEILVHFLESAISTSVSRKAESVASNPSSPRSSRSLVTLQTDLTDHNNSKNLTPIQPPQSSGGLSPMPTPSLNPADLAMTITPLPGVPNQSPNFGSLGSESTNSDGNGTDLVIALNDRNSEKTMTETGTTTAESTRTRGQSKLQSRMRREGDGPLTIDAVQFDKEQIQMHKIQTSLQDLTLPVSVVDTPMDDSEDAH